MARTLLRSRTGERDEGKVGFVELFFDLVFVFAVTQLSHGLIAHLTPGGVLETAILLLAVWLAWMYTTWATNWLDVERMPVRLMLFVLMGLGLVMSIAIPDAFGNLGMAFVIAYLLLQIGRSLFTLLALKPHEPDNYRNFQRIIAWALLAAPLWIAGALADHDARVVLWMIALAIEYTGPMVAFWFPLLGRTETTTWNVEGHHLSERCGLFVIIALGESILITGATFAEVAWTAPAVAGFVSAFLATVAMWWTYFNVGAERAAHKISHHHDPGRMARLSYTYLHVPIVAGIIATAAADELVLKHPEGTADATTTAIIFGGPALYLAGNIAFKRTTASNMPLSHLIGLGLLAAAALELDGSPALLSVAATAILILVATWETLSLKDVPNTEVPVSE